MRTIIVIVQFTFKKNFRQLNSFCFLRLFFAVFITFQPIHSAIFFSCTNESVAFHLGRSRVFWVVGAVFKSFSLKLGGDFLGQLITMATGVHIFLRLFFSIFKQNLYLNLKVFFSELEFLRRRKESYHCHLHFKK